MYDMIIRNLSDIDIYVINKNSSIVLQHWPYHHETTVIDCRVGVKATSKDYLPTALLVTWGLF